MLPIYPGPERRKYPRIYVQLPMQYRKIGEFDKLPADTITKDISVGRIGFTAQTFLPVGNRLMINIVLKPYTESIKTVAKVVWIKKHPYNDTYELGCQFEEIKEGMQARIYCL